MTYVILGALAIGISLGLFGSGGSILTVPVLLYLLGHEAKVAIAESLGIVGGIALACAIPYARARLVDWRTAVLFGAPGMVGTYVGAWVGGFVPATVQLLVFGGVMLAAAITMLRPPKVAVDGAPARRRAVGRVVIDGTAVGALTGFVGVGGGFLVVPSLVLLGGLELRTAVGTSLVVIAMNTLIGFGKHLQVLNANGLAVDASTMLLLTSIGIAGSFGGRALGATVDTTTLRRAFGAFLVVMALFVLGSEFVEPAPSDVQGQRDAPAAAAGG
ncbi:MAG: sulfite exporter TauE/SafE family protein [Planctomycetota bacterium]